MHLSLVSLKSLSVFYLLKNNMDQIIRIPIKYWELFQTMDNEEAWKLMKALFIWKDEWLNWLTLTYFNIIIVDINNLFNNVANWKKGGRPKNKTSVIEKEKGGLLEKEKGGLKKIEPIESKVNESKKEIYKGWWDSKLLKLELTKFIDHWNNLYKENREVTEILIDAYKIKRKKYTKENFYKWYSLYNEKKKDTTDKKFLLSPISVIQNNKNGFISYL